MKKLNDILQRAGVIDIIGNADIEISMLCMDSREVSAHSLYIAVKGGISDGHNYIQNAISEGAVGVVCEMLPDMLETGITYVHVKNSRMALGHIASNFYDHPSSRIKLIGVTGTNGKTTVATCLYELFTRMGYSCGLISTIRNKINHDEFTATHTTPDAISLNRLLYQMVEKKCTYCFMEVSSHALDQGRTEGIEFRGAIFTNITHDHLDYHHTFQNYILAKKKLFDNLTPQSFALINVDDRHATVMVQNTKAHVYSYGLSSAADFKTRIIEDTMLGLHINMDGNDLYSTFVGKFNAYNLLAIYACGVIFGNGKQETAIAISALNPPDGRFQILQGVNGIIAVVDYAHTPDALENVLQTLRSIVKNQQKIIIVVGCGGNRDKAKRPLMGKVAVRYADKCIFTSDNPRDEDPLTIINEMKSELTSTDMLKVLSIVDRKEAIHSAAAMAGNNDVILIAGKGHEKYQESAGNKVEFDDWLEIKNAFELIKEKI